MEIVNPCKVYLSNIEVYQILKQQKESRDISLQLENIPGNSTKRRISISTMQEWPNENVLTIEFEILKKLDTCEALNPKFLSRLVQELKGFNLERFEILQILNIQSRSKLELYMIIEDIEDRFDDATLQKVLEMIHCYLPRISSK